MTENDFDWGDHPNDEVPIRNKAFSVYVTQEERAHLHSAARAARIAVSSWARALLLDAARHSHEQHRPSE